MPVYRSDTCRIRGCASAAIDNSPYCSKHYQISARTFSTLRWIIYRLPRVIASDLGSRASDVRRSLNGLSNPSKPAGARVTDPSSARQPRAMAIRDVFVFVERLSTNPIPEGVWKSKASRVSPPAELIESADNGMQLGGLLSAWVAQKGGFAIEKILPMSQSDQDKLFGKKARGSMWRVWYASTPPTHKYHVLVVVE